MITTINTKIMHTLQLITIKHKHNPQKLTLITFNKTKPLHTYELTKKLKINIILIPKNTNTLSTLGLTTNNKQQNHIHSYLIPLTKTKKLPNKKKMNLHYTNQSFKLTIPLNNNLTKSFHITHKKHYNYTNHSHPIKLITIQTTNIKLNPILTPQPKNQLEISNPNILELNNSTY